MKLSRRGILKALPALPFATKAAAAEAEKMIGADLVGPTNLRNALGIPSAAGYVGEGSETYLRNMRRRLASFIGGFPEFRMRRFQRQARDNRRLDPDIACLKSVSIGSKLRMQQNATLRQLQRDELERLEANIDEQLWAKAMGIEDSDW